MKPATMYYKLVRDKVLDEIDKDGLAYSATILNDDESIITALKDKIVEESEEFADSNCDIYELADIFEVLIKIMKMKNITFTELKEARNKRIKDKGAFDNNVFLLFVENKDEPTIEFEEA